MTQVRETRLSQVTPLWCPASLHRPEALEVSEFLAFCPQPLPAGPEDMVSEELQPGPLQEYRPEEPETHLLSAPARQGPRSKCVLVTFSWLLFAAYCQLNTD